MYRKALIKWLSLDVFVVLELIIGTVRQIAKALIVLIFLAPAICMSSTWVLIDTKTAILQIMDGQKIVAKWEDISVGRSGVTDLHIKGDDKTPRGVFNITRINKESRFRLFFEINYPTIQHAQEALAQGVIDEKTYMKIKINQQAYGHSPQNTALGGHLGIHGLGSSDPEFHEMFNWTNGCVALSNKQIDELSHWIQLGTKVVIE